MLRCLGFSIGLNMRKQTKCSSSRIGNSCLPDRTGKIRSKARWLKCYIIYSPHVDTLISQVATLPWQWSFTLLVHIKHFPDGPSLCALAREGRWQKEHSNCEGTETFRSVSASPFGLLGFSHSCSLYAVDWVPETQLRNLVSAKHSHKELDHGA